MTRPIKVLGPRQWINETVSSTVNPQLGGLHEYGEVGGLKVRGAS